jgi:hypothetical protein
MTGSAMRTARFIACRVKMRLNTRLKAPPGSAVDGSERCVSWAAGAESIPSTLPARQAQREVLPALGEYPWYCAADLDSQARGVAIFLRTSSSADSHDASRTPNRSNSFSLERMEFCGRFAGVGKALVGIALT